MSDLVGNPEDRFSHDEAHNSPEYWLIPRKQWLHPDMTEKLFTGNVDFKPLHKQLISGRSSVIEPPCGKTNNVVFEQVRHMTNRAVQAQKMAKGLKFRI